MDAKTTKLAQQIGFGALGLGLVYSAFKAFSLGSKLDVAAERCRRATNDFMVKTGMSPADAVNRSIEYCGDRGSGLSKEAP